MSEIVFSAATAAASSDRHGWAALDRYVLGALAAKQDCTARQVAPHVPFPIVPQVMRTVLGTPGVARLVRAIAAAVHAYRRGPRPGPVVVAVGCVGGRHRAAGIAIETARLLERDGVPVTVTHRDMHHPVLGRPCCEGTAA